MQQLAHDLALSDAVRDALAGELRDELVEPVMDWDRLRTEGRAQFAVVTVPPVVTVAQAGVGTDPRQWRLTGLWEQLGAGAGEPGTGRERSWLQ